jgi:polyisoprenoid-binding protein YceI
LNLRRCASFICFVALGVPSLPAQQRTFTVAPGQSRVDFSLGSILRTIHGTFRIQSGSMQFDSDAGQISGSIVVAAGSGKSGNDERDRRMTTEVLNAPRFAVASFTPQRLEGSVASSGDSTVEITGIFTLHGDPHELTIPVKIHIDGADCTAKTGFLVPYVKWGMTDPSDFKVRVSKVVKIDLTLRGQISPVSGK